MEELLIRAGLTDSQAQVYLYLLEHGPSVPAEMAKHLSVKRSNAYKVLDSLEELDLVSRIETNKKFTYQATDPSALASLLAEKRNLLIALEHDVKKAMISLRSLNRSKSKGSKIVFEEGEAKTIGALRNHQTQGETVHFIKSRADIPFFGFETMDKIRRLAARHGIRRFGITQDATEGSKNTTIDQSINLTRTWINAGDYLSPVEWSVSGNELLIVKFDNSGEYVRISDPIIADSFREIWKLTDKALRNSKDYKNIGKKAKREI